jgi:putative transposase
MSIRTYKVKIPDGFEFHKELRLAKQVAQFAVRTKSRSSKDVANIGLKSAISNQILKKYRSRKVKRVHKVKLTVPSQGIKCDPIKQIIIVPCLKLKFSYQFPNSFEKVNQIEIGHEYIYVSVTLKDLPQIDTDRFIGVDLNATGHCAVVADPEGRVYMLCRKAQHIHLKYLRYRKRYQQRGLYRKLSKSKSRESNIVKDLNHKISKNIVQIAIKNNSGIKLEDLSGIRKTTRTVKSFRYTLNSWSYYQLGTLVSRYSTLILLIQVRTVPDVGPEVKGTANIFHAQFAGTLLMQTLMQLLTLCPG